MEHQSAVTYGNHFANGYLGARLDRRRHQPAVRFHHHPRKRPRVVRQQRHGGRPLRHVDSRRLDDLSRSASTSSTCAGTTTRSKYLNGYKTKVQNQRADHHAARHQRARRRRTSISRARSSSTRCAASSTTTRDGGRCIHDFYQHFKYQNIMTEDSGRATSTSRPEWT